MGMNDFDDLDFEEMDADDSITTEDQGNRTFLIVAGILGGILLLALIAIAAYAVLFLPGREGAQQTQVAAINATNTAIAVQSEQTAVAKQTQPLRTNTPTVTTVPTETATPAQEATATSTPVVAPTDTPVVETDTPSPETATVAALLTQQAAEEEAGTPDPTATALPDTGFADDVGVPGLLALAAVLLMVIFLSRRLRSSSVS